jgi:basic membrane lipoprotein Med (substrate-binding protein (PBP1-ABC) superfamily)
VVSSQVFNWSPVIGQMIENILTGTPGGVAYELALDNGGLTFAYGQVEISDGVMAGAEGAIDAINDGVTVVKQELPEE